VFPECSDGIDNDGNGCVDYPDDSGCDSLKDNNESGGSCPTDEDNDNNNENGDTSECTEDWDCTEWTGCGEDSYRRRDCVDLNFCGTGLNKPDEIESCYYEKPNETEPKCIPNWSCYDWSECDDQGKRTRECVDLGNCFAESYEETEICELSIRRVELKRPYWMFIPVVILLGIISFILFKKPKKKKGRKKKKKA
jgi:hypothetical protein